MKTTENIKNTIDRLPKGYVFTYDDFDVEVKTKEAVIKALNRMVDSGKISKLAKGKYYKPEKTPFGTLQPSQEQIVKDLLYEDGKTVGYLTGYSIYNKLGLTTQVSNIIQIGKNELRPKFNRGRYTISFVKQKNTITSKNIPLLQILDAIKYIKKIPDSNVRTSCLRFLEILKDLNLNDKRELIRLSLKYPPSTRALLGALLDEVDEEPISSTLKKSLNPITKYEIPQANEILNTTSDWNIL
ncbi:type IV toxin-antitoxin system AbiEi family antitoxin domain-containing protein [Psychroflexus aestuariivivens]|uniref:type IV toxin-antitoxin system AbiEi family antitoxin domain-containing protein n=1 Tax=Psychroflexus aestuariivivens TaxID=1795040 RepID=UPI000FD797C6|nr:DUF6088 family protein [Psychroflexus aestuariivivens]